MQIGPDPSIGSTPSQAAIAAGFPGPPSFSRSYPFSLLMPRSSAVSMWPSFDQLEYPTIQCIPTPFLPPEKPLSSPLQTPRSIAAAVAYPSRNFRRTPACSLSISPHPPKPSSFGRSTQSPMRLSSPTCSPYLPLTRVLYGGVKGSMMATKSTFIDHLAQAELAYSLKLKQTNWCIVNLLFSLALSMTPHWPSGQRRVQ